MIPERLPGGAAPTLGLLVVLASLVAGSILAVSGCASRPPGNLLDGSQAIALTVSLATAVVDSTGATVPAVRVSLSHSALIFKRQGTEIAAGLEITVSAFSGQKLVGGGVATARVRAAHWQAIAADSVLTVLVPLQIDSATEVDLQISARSLYSSRFWRRSLRCLCRQWEFVPLSVLTFVWNVGSSGIVAQGQDSLIVSVEVAESPVPSQFDSAWDTGTVALALEIKGRYQPFTYHQAKPVSRGQALVPLVLDFRIPTAKIPFGEMVVTPYLERQSGAAETRLPLQGGRFFHNQNLEFTDDELWQQQLGWLAGKSSTGSLAQLAACSPAERAGCWQEFWVSNGPLLSESGQKHNLRDHLLLIAEADRRFSRGKPGSASALGKALIQYGIPDRIDRREDASRRDERWQTWVYNSSHLRLVFQDPHGLGDYRLVAKELP